MKYLKHLIAIFLFFPFMLFAQQYGNEWINFNQEYYKIKIAEDGIYRIDYNTLQSYGFPVSSVNPVNIQVFGRGQELPIFIQGESDGSFDQGDYIEFYGEANDGWLDKQLYLDPTTHMNDDYSLFSDTAEYFLTWNNSTANNRFNIVSNTNFSAYTPENYIKKIVRQEYNNRYYEGEPSSYGVTDPEYTEGEGWFDHPFNLGGSRSKSIATPGIYSSGPQAKIRFAVVGASDYVDNGTNISPDHHLRVQFANQVLDTLYSGYGIHRFKRSIALSDLSSNNSVVFSSINDLNVGADRNAVAYLEIEYPKVPSLGNSGEEMFYLDDVAANYARIDFSGFSASASASVYVYDLTNGKRMTGSRNGSDLQVLIPNGVGEKYCYLTSSDDVKMVGELLPVTNSATPNRFTDYSGSSADFIIVSHNELIGSSAQSIQNYASYRDAQGYQSLIVDVDELYSQFAYGVHNHPLGIRKFVEYAWDNFSGKPEYLFLIGKGYRASDADTREGVLYHQNMVPSMGNAPSDILFSSGIVDNLYQPALATGRLSAKTTDDVDLYLEKVKEYDLARANPDLWQKRILHFAGGLNTAEQSMIQSFLNSYSQIARDTFLGANIYTVNKTSSDPIQINKADEVRDYINNGSFMLMFFGHAFGSGFDINIDDPDTYQNQGKYPFLFANSCYSGDLFLTSESSSEQWVLIEDKGMIAYLASISPAIPSSLNVYSTWFHRNLSANSYGESLGKVIKQTIQDIQIDNFNRKEICLAMTLHGDPALALYNQDKPDYKVTNSDINFLPSVISTDIDTFRVQIAVQNVGRAVRDSFLVEINRTYPQGSITETQTITMTAPFNKDTIIIKLPVNKTNGIGLNQLEIRLDATNDVDELSELNNVTTVDFLIKSANLIPVYPEKFAIVPGPDVTLKASTSNPFVKQKSFVFQIDTTDKFNSPVLMVQQLSSAGGVLEWTPPISMQDSVVYYWRVSLDSVYSGEYDWRLSSFQYISGQRGWSQAHFPQFKDDIYRYVKPLSGKRKFEFINITNQLSVKTGVYPNINITDCSFRFNNALIRAGSCLRYLNTGLMILAFDTLSGEAIFSKKNGIQANGLGQFNNVHCLDHKDMATYDFFTTSTVGYSQYYEAPQDWWFDQIVNFIDSLPNGTPVIIYSVENHNAENYTNQMYQAIESLGSAFIRTIDNDQAYILYGRKGDNIGDAHEVVGLGPTDIITLTDSIQSRWKEGFVKSPVIGPSQKWQSLHWDFDYSDAAPIDFVRLDVIGYHVDGSVDTVMHNLPPDSSDIYGLDKIFSAKDYPRIQLVMSTRDDSLNTPAQLKKWQVIHAGIPETALNPKKVFSFHNDTIMQGDTARLVIGTENISDYDMDSLRVKYWVIDNNRVEHQLGEFTRNPHPSGDVLVDTLEFDTKDYEELNKLWVEFNPNNDQLELTHINNIAEIPFFVQSDVTNPLLDVTFDGIHIMDGDIVSSEPHILIRLSDENKFLALDDTSKFNVFLKKPSEQNYRKLHFMKRGMEQLVFHPASLPENECMIEYNADFDEDGVYNLRVQAQDESGNKSGEIDYNINFEVVNKSTITNVLNWPNPFSTRTHFVFTLTGSRVPDYMKIQIMTVTGKVVREIEMDELGPIHIGKNITEYAWDGTDEFGDRLANGVYLYRVITDMNGQEIDKRATAADKYFEHGFGKMYLIR